MNAAIRAALDQSARGEISYPVLAKLLREAGIRTYDVAVAAHTATYRGDGEAFTLQGTAVAGAGEKPPSFDQPGIVAAILASQRREINYDGFLRRIWQSGVASYHVDLDARVISYEGPGGEAHVEKIPDV